MKREVYIYLAIFMALSFTMKAQNLVPNYSFEDTIKCSNWLNQFTGYVVNWTGQTPSYFNTLCNTSGSEVNVPDNIWGYQYPHSGSAYAGIYTFIDSTYDPPNYNVRDYIQVKLNDSLINGLRYYTTFYVSLGDSEKYACNNIGAYFSDSALVWTGYVKSNLKPQVENDTSNHLTDKINWMKISGSFVAQGGEKYLIIGNFIDDRHVDTIFVNSLGHKENLWTDSYYYIDDVIVSPDSNYADSLFSAVQNVNKPKAQVKVYPNPSNGKFAIELKMKNEKLRMKVYNMFGEEVYCREINSETTQVNLNNTAKGLYLYRAITPEGKLVGQGKFVIR